MANRKAPKRLLVKAGVVLVIVFLVLAISVPGARERGMLLFAKLTGSSTTAWREVAVQMLPFRWQERARQLIPRRAVEWNRQLDFPLPPDSKQRVSHILFEGPTPNLRVLDCHFTVLPQDQIPHPPHVHDDEEIILPLSGEVDIIRADTADAEKIQVERVGFGYLVYHPSRLPHTIRAVGPGPSGYLVFRWSTAPDTAMPREAIAPQSFDLRNALDAAPGGLEHLSRSLIFEGPTRHLARLHAHLSFARPGYGSEPHQDPHDVAVLVLRGSVETTTGRVEAPGVIFHPARKTHFLRNVGEGTAQYLAIEFLKRD
ncbi:MAG: hypothetical protein AB1898_08855 [Acidobacteriota bacterium]